MRVIVKKERLKEAMFKKGFSNRELANEIGITPVSLSRIINGKNNPSPRVAKRLTDMLKLEFDDIFEIKEEVGGLNESRNQPK